MNTLNLRYHLVETIIIIQRFSLIRIICTYGRGTPSCSSRCPTKSVAYLNMFESYLQPAPCVIQDKSFTCTLFAPTTEFETLSDKDQVLSWFRIHFPDTLELIGTEGLLNSFQQNPRNPLISIKVRHFHSLTPLAYTFFPHVRRQSHTITRIVRSSWGTQHILWFPSMGKG